MPLHDDQESPNNQRYGAISATSLIDRKLKNSTDDVRSTNCEECPTRCDEIIDQSNERLIKTESNENKAEARNALLSTLFLLLALCLHTLFEGLTFGLLQSETAVWSLFVAIAIHKVVISLSLGLQIVENVPSKRRGILFIIIFSFSCAVGGITGVIVAGANVTSLTSQIVSNVLQGVATGTFIQVIFFEILQKELGQESSLGKVFATLVGFTTMAVLTYFLPS